jgi:hypothetical protein
MNPGQQKISQFQPVESTRANDIIPIVRDGQNRSITIGKFTGVLPSGWTTPAENWTYSNFDNGIAAITVPEGDIRRYPNGLRVQFKQGTPPTTRFGIVVASTSTMVYLYMINGTTLENLEIRDVFISPDFAPGTDEGVNFNVEPTIMKREPVGVLFCDYIRRGNVVIADVHTTAALPRMQERAKHSSGAGPAVESKIPKGFSISAPQTSALMTLGGWNNRVLKAIATARFYDDGHIEYVANDSYNEWYGTTSWITDDPFPVTV